MQSMQFEVGQEVRVKTYSVKDGEYERIGIVIDPRNYTGAGSQQMKVQIGKWTEVVMKCNCKPV